MRTYIDQSRVARNSDRRLHAADLEMSGRFVQLVPAIAQKLAPRAVTTDWAREIERLKGIEDELMALGKRREQHRCQRERWWCELWAQPKGLYRVKEMTEEQIEEALQLLNDRTHGLPSECFPDAKGPLEEHNDALIVAQVIVMGGHLILTSNMSFVETEPLEDWRRRHGNQYGTPAEVPLVQQADAMYTRWLDHPIGREVLRRTTLGAFWPENDEASEHEVVQAAIGGVEALQRGGHITVFAERMHDALASEPEKTSEAVRRTRENLPLRTRAAERRWLEMYEGKNAEHETARLQPPDTDWSRRRWP